MAKYEESKETPQIEARSHTPGFLKRAAKLAAKKSKRTKRSKARK